MKKVLLVLFICVFTALSSFAVDNVLQSVQIEPLDDTFNIVLVADNSVSIKKTIQSPNRIVLTLKGIRASKTLSTVYKNVSNVDNIIVEPSGIDGLNIMFQADNASNAKVSFDSLVSSVKVDQRANPKKEIILNAPMNTYSPIYPQEEEKGTSLLSNIHLGGVVSYFKAMLSGHNTVKFMIFGLFGLIFMFGAKLIRGKDNNITVGLSSRDLRSRDIANTKEVANFMTAGNSLNKPYTSMNYGVKAYQNSTPSPYLKMQTKSDSTTLNARLNSLPKRNLMADSIPEQRIQSTPTMPAIQRRPVSMISKPKIQPKKIDSIKFLESMSNIYEKSGRPDLANGIRTKLSKINN